MTVALRIIEFRVRDSASSLSCYGEVGTLCYVMQATALYDMAPCCLIDMCLGPKLFTSRRQAGSLLREVGASLPNYTAGIFTVALVRISVLSLDQPKLLIAREV